MMKSRFKISFDEGWRFHLGDIESIRNRWAWGKSGSWNQGPESREFDDSDWREVTLPHDFVIETVPFEYSEQEFNNDNAIPAMEDVGNIHTTAGSFKKDVGWYRKHFFIPKEWLGKKLFLVFEGIYRDSHAFLNEFYIGGERSGYSRIVYDITDVAEYGGDNILSVKCDARGAEGWFYEGGGIYRHAYLTVVSKEHIKDIFVHADVDYTNKTAHVYVESEFSDELLSAELSVTVKDPEGNEICINPGENAVVRNSSSNKLDFNLHNIFLWDTEHPYLYNISAALIVDGREVDRTETRFGLRDIRFDSEEGFFLNGVPTDIKGVCCHQNHGGVGTAISDELYRYRLLKLKELGANGYRTSHYPPSPVLLDLCDELGILVMDETRLLSSEAGDLNQLRTLVIRDRNHPSVIMYSIGNEEAQSQHIPQGARIAGTQIKLIKKLDPTRPVTMALLMLYLKTGERIKNPHWLDGIGEQLDVAGFNYNMDMWQPYRDVHPGQPIISTEQGTFRSTRGCCETDDKNCHRAMGDKNDGQYMVGAERWHGIRNSWMPGQFLWTGFDYYGEPTPYKWPAISSQFGIMDLCGFPKDFYYYYKAWWNEEEPLVHICCHWNELKSDKRDVHVFSNCESIELIRNGESLGIKEMPQDGYVRWDDVKYEPGELIAVGYRNGEKVSVDKVHTTGRAVDLRVNLEYHEGDLYIYRVEAIDEAGVLVPDGNIYAEFDVRNGKIIGTCNGNPSDHTTPVGKTRATFNGLAQVLVISDKEPGLSFTLLH